MLQFSRSFYLYTDRYETKKKPKDENNSNNQTQTPVNNEENNLQTTGSLI